MDRAHSVTIPKFYGIFCIAVVLMGLIDGSRPHCTRYCTNMLQKDGPCPKQFTIYIYKFTNCGSNYRRNINMEIFILYQISSVSVSNRGQYPSRSGCSLLLQWMQRGGWERVDLMGDLSLHSPCSGGFCPIELGPTSCSRCCDLLLEVSVPLRFTLATLQHLATPLSARSNLSEQYLWPHAWVIAALKFGTAVPPMTDMWMGQIWLVLQCNVADHNITDCWALGAHVLWLQLHPWTYTKGCLDHMLQKKV